MSWLNESNYGNNIHSNTENVVVVEALRKMQRLGTKLGFAPK
jgi:glycerol-3-phosphate dehydrogenase